MACKYKDASILQKGLVWVLLKYPDKSEFCFQTTLNPELLRKYDVILEEGKLVRLDKRYLQNGQMVYKQFPYGNAKITLWDGMTYTDEKSAELRDFL